MKTKIKGVITALATPFLNDQVDTASLIKLIKDQMQQGVDGFVVNGTTGESPTLSLKEVKQIYDITRTESGGRVPVIVGTGSNSTADTCELTKEVGAWKPDAVLVVVPYYNRPPQRGLLQHFTRVANVAGSPVILYNVPSRTVAALEVPTIVELSQHPNIAGIKEASGNMETLEQLRASAAKDFVLLSGDDASSVEFCARGGHGVISVSSHIIGREMKQHLADKSTDAFAKIFAPLMKHLYIEANPIPLKAALKWMGLFATMDLRLPLSALDERYHKEFKACLAALGKC